MPGEMGGTGHQSYWWGLSPDSMPAAMDQQKQSCLWAGIWGHCLWLQRTGGPLSTDYLNLTQFLQPVFWISLVWGLWAVALHSQEPLLFLHGDGFGLVCSTPFWGREEGKPNHLQSKYSPTSFHPFSMIPCGRLNDDLPFPSTPWWYVLRGEKIAAATTHTSLQLSWEEAVPGW